MLCRSICAFVKTKRNRLEASSEYFRDYYKGDTIAQMIFDGEKLKMDIVSLLEVYTLLLIATFIELPVNFILLDFGPET